MHGSEGPSENLNKGQKNGRRTSLFTVRSSARTWSNPDIGARKMIESTDVSHYLAIVTTPSRVE